MRKRYKKVAEAQRPPCVCQRTDNDAEARFCGHCGGLRQKMCMGCNKILSARFCTACGSDSRTKDDAVAPAVEDLTDLVSVDDNDVNDVVSND